MEHHILRHGWSIWFSHPSMVNSGDPSSPASRHESLSRGIGRSPKSGKVAPRWCSGVPYSSSRRMAFAPHELADARHKLDQNGTVPVRSPSEVEIIQESALGTTNDSRTKPRLDTCRSSHSIRLAYTRNTL